MIVIGNYIIFTTISVLLFKLAKSVYDTRLELGCLIFLIFFSSVLVIFLMTTLVIVEIAAGRFF